MTLYLRTYHDDEKVHELQLEERPIVIGRGPGSDILLSDLSVSRVHARIEPHGNFYLIRDNRSTNGTFVNERAVLVEFLHPGDTIRIGKFIIRVEASLERRGDTSKIRIEAIPVPVADNPESGAKTTAVSSLRVEEAAARESDERLVKLYRIQKQLGFVDSLPSLLDRSLGHMLEELDADRGCILLADFQSADEVRQPQDLVPSAIASRTGTPSSRPGDEAPEILVPEELVRSIVAQKASTRLASVGGAEADDGNAPESRPEAMGAPFLAQERLLGIVYLERQDRTRPFDDEDLQFLTLFASMVAVNLTNTLLFDEIFAEKEKLQAVIANLSDGVLLADKELHVIEASARAATLLGEKENVVGKSLFELIGRFECSISRQLIRQETEHGGSIFQLDTPAGDSTLKVRIAPFVGNVSGFRGRIVLVQDATENRRLEEKKIQFIRNIAHKLRTPLTLIEGNLPLLHGEIAETSAEAEVLRDVEKGSRTLCELVDGFVNFLEMEIRELRAQTPSQAINVHDLSWDAINHIKAAAAEKRILINNRLPGDLPRVVAQPARVVEALVRVLENAVKFSPQGGVVAMDCEVGEDVLRLHVDDEGPGIPSGDQEAVFRVFHQVDAEGTGEVPGLGLGLAIARQIVQEQGGDIQITSPFRTPDRGCRLTILMPIGAPSPAGAASADLHGAPRR